MGNCLQKETGDSDGDDKVDFKGGNVHVITSKRCWDEKIAEANEDGKIVVANFSAAWCDPCRSITPIYKELSEKHPSLMFLTVDVDELTEFCSTWEIRATPTFYFFKNGQELDKLVGANRTELEKKILMYADSASELSNLG